MANPRKSMAALRGLSIPPPAVSLPSGSSPMAEASGSPEATQVAANTAKPRKKTAAPRRPARENEGASIHRAPSSQRSRARRDRATTVYLSGRAREHLLAERARTGLASADVILVAVQLGYRGLNVSAPGEEDRDLGLPAPRRPRRNVEDGRQVLVRFSEEEKEALDRLADEAGMSTSEMVSACLGD